MILGLVIDGDGWPICTEMWPGNTADVATLLNVVDRLRQRFAIRRVCIVADRGMISAATIAGLEERDSVAAAFVLRAEQHGRAVRRRLEHGVEAGVVEPATHEGDVLWTPSADRVGASRLADYQRWLEQCRGS